MLNKGMILPVLLCTALMMTGCGSGKSVDYKTDDAGVSGAGAAVSEEVADDADGSLLTQQLGIPESARIDLPVDGTNLKKITVDASSITVPDRDRMYTKSYRMGILTDETREEIVKSFLDESDGIYNFPEELFNAKDKDRESVE